MYQVPGIQQCARQTQPPPPPAWHLHHTCTWSLTCTRAPTHSNTDLHMSALQLRSFSSKYFSEFFSSSPPPVSLRHRDWWMELSSLFVQKSHRPVLAKPPQFNSQSGVGQTSWFLQALEIPGNQTKRDPGLRGWLILNPRMISDVPLISSKHPSFSVDTCHLQSVVIRASWPNGQGFPTCDEWHVQRLCICITQHWKNARMTELEGHGPNGSPMAGGGGSGFHGQARLGLPDSGQEPIPYTKWMSQCSGAHTETGWLVPL